MVVKVCNPYIQMWEQNEDSKVIFVYVIALRPSKKQTKIPQNLHERIK